MAVSTVATECSAAPLSDHYRVIRYLSAFTGPCNRRIGQSVPVNVNFLGYSGTAQMACLSLMAKKIAVSQSTSGDMPDTGLDVLNQDGDSIEVALARKLVS
jgi:hypothetical protein